MRAAAMLLETYPRLLRRPRKRSCDIAIGLAKLDQQVARLAAVHWRRASAQGIAAIGHRRQRLIIDLDPSGSILRNRTRPCDHESYGFTDIGDFIFGEHERGNVS